MNEEVEVLKEYVEALGLQDKEGLTIGDLSALRTMLRDAGEFGLADYVERLNGPDELTDLIVNTLYDS